MTEPNREIIERWVAALESGEYKQAEYALRRGDRYCCLGVLCDLYAKEKNEEWKPSDYRIGQSDEPVYILHEQENVLPHAVREWAGFKENIPTVNTLNSPEILSGGMDQHDLTSLNDESGLSFSQIATLIRKTYLS